jgi:hypothetical protein
MFVEHGIEFDYGSPAMANQAAIMQGFHHIQLRKDGRKQLVRQRSQPIHDKPMVKCLA